MSRLGGKVLVGLLVALAAWFATSSAAGADADRTTPGAPSSEQQDQPTPSGLLGTLEAVGSQVVEPVATNVADPALAPVRQEIIEPAADEVVHPIARASAPTVEPLAGRVVAPVADAAAPVVKPIVRAVEPIIEPVRTAAQPLLEPVIDTVEPVVQPVASSLAPIAQPVLEAAAPETEPIPSLIDAVPADDLDPIDPPSSAPEPDRSIRSETAIVDVDPVGAAPPTAIATDAQPPAASTADLVRLTSDPASTPTPMPIPARPIPALPSMPVTASGGATSSGAAAPAPLLVAVVPMAAGAGRLVLVGLEDPANDVLPSSYVGRIVRLPG
jgi:hypothetical protein